MLLFLIFETCIVFIVHGLFVVVQTQHRGQQQSGGRQQNQNRSAHVIWTVNVFGLIYQTIRKPSNGTFLRKIPAVGVSELDKA